ncbi:dynamin family protein [Rhodoferax antarcticus]|uniref:dynamin family protein n=1 Tax=Rhodoferax antarcticus TaxID=81479 RepID=UPI0022253BDA|nr:dynamin family protein [Rhodoferax antarcticus]MCW2313546.1 putative GTPase [Rhodoferax antarcticus]
MTSLISRQTTLQQQLQAARDIYARHGLSQNRIDEIAPLIAHFEIRIPLIGAFSCGKSSLLNALLGESLLSTAVTPETAVPAELRYGPERRFSGCLPDGQRLALTETDLRDNRLAPLLAGGWVEAQLPSPALATRQQLVLVDLPGWDSGVAAHERVIDDYAGRSFAYGVVVGVEEGALRDSLRRALLELAIAQMPVVLIISKADTRPPEDVQAVAEHLRADITALMGRAPLAIAITSARKKDIGKFEAALDTLQAQAGDIFETRIVDTYRSDLQHAAQHLGLLANQNNKDAAHIQADMDKLEQDIRAFDSRLQKETDALEAQVAPILGTIRLRVENALGGRIDMLTERALNGQNISDDILGTARLVIAEALRKEFEPAMQRYLDRLVDALPSRLDFNLNLGQVKLEGIQTDGGEFRWKTLAVTLAPVVAKLPHPLAQILAPLLPILGALLDSKADRQRQEIEEARQRERAKSGIRSALNNAVQQIDAQLRPVLSEQVQKARVAVARNIDIERNEVKATLATLAKALQQGEAEVAALRQCAQADIDRLHALLAELTPAV